MLFHKNSQTFRILFQNTTLFGIKIGYHKMPEEPVYVHCEECTSVHRAIQGKKRSHWSV